MRKSSRSQIIRRKGGQFILTGSAKLELMKGVSESLAGRVSICELGVSLQEIYQVPFNGHFVPSEQYISELEKRLKPYVVSEIMKSYSNEGRDYQFMLDRP